MIKWPALWVRFSDVLEYNEENRDYCIGPFNYEEGWSDPITGDPIYVKVSGQYLTPEEVNRSRDIYISFVSDDTEVQKKGLCGRKQGVGQIVWSLDTGEPLISQHVSLDDLPYPDYEEYGSFIFKEQN